MATQPAEGISETVSENAEEAPPKRGRGRPRLINEQGRAMVGRLYAGVGSARGQNGKYYMMIAINTFVGLETHEERARYSWVCPDGAILALLGATLPGGSVGYRANVRLIRGPNGEPGPSLRETLLTELGRVLVDYGQDTMLDAARQLCDMEPKPTTREAVAMVRRWRLAPSRKDAAPAPPGGVSLKLISALEKFLDDYLKAHPEVSDAILKDAVECLFDEVCGDDPPDEDEAPE